MSCRDNKHHRKKQRDLEILLPQISLMLTDSPTLNFQFSIFNFQFSILKKTPRGIYFVSLLSSLRSARAQLLNAARLFCLNNFWIVC